MQQDFLWESCMIYNTFTLLQIDLKQFCMNEHTSFVGTPLSCVIYKGRTKQIITLKRTRKKHSNRESIHQGAKLKPLLFTNSYLLHSFGMSENPELLRLR